LLLGGGATAESMPLRNIVPPATLSLELLVKAHQSGGTIFSVASNVTFAVTCGDVRSFARVIANPDRSASVIMQSLFRPILGSIVTLSHTGNATWKAVSYGSDPAGNKLTLLSLDPSSFTPFSSLPVNSTSAGMWTTDTVQIHYGSRSYDTGIALEVSNWNQLSLVWAGDEVDVYVFDAVGVYSQRSFVLGPSVFVNGAVVGLGRWETSARSGVPPGVEFVGEVDELRLWSRLSDLFVVTEGPIRISLLTHPA